MKNVYVRESPREKYKIEFDDKIKQYIPEL